jgi:alkanesulfonate monooxygenase SsuD/methylene tetrahydromethanopterin reductase-like flavin-dependent oxidoreductase (luciferase family)
MDVGIGLPNAVLGIRGPELVDWARRAEAAGFSSLGTIGRFVYDSHEDLISLAAAAGATSRIGLMTTVLVGPPRQPVLLAKQAATLSAVSGGRFRLGIGLGPRDDDWAVLDTPMDGKGRRLEELIATCRAVWAGEPPKGAEDPVGPRPIDLPIVLGGFSPPAFRRAGRLADGFIAGPMPPEAVAQAIRSVEAAAAEAGRPRPRMHAARYVALGADAQEEADHNAASYYGFGGAELVAGVQGGLLRTADQVRGALDALREAGVDEVVLWPEAAAVDQVDRIAAAALR